ncbi:MAG: CoA transferase [Chloroflexi bacterium]|nr:CoA transferase [Chloroflexota bacterium]
MINLPLDEIRILDLSQVYAGPYATRLLADMGAEVIRVESAVRSTRGGPEPQPGAVYPDGNPGERPYNRSAYYNELNRNKLAISLDLSKEKGREVFKQLVKISDVVLENFTPRVMGNFGLDYPVLNEINPKIIVVSISAYGQTGPYRNYVSFGRGIEAMSGLSDITAYEDGEPLGPGIAYADATAGLHAAFAVLIALRHRRKTGRGQHIDLSLRESLLALMGEHVLDHSMNKRSPKGNGNRDSSAPFQGCYRCSGDDEWIAIAVHNDDELQSLCNAIDNPSWTKKEGFNNLLGWQRNQREIDNLIEQWTIQHDNQSAMQILQQSGIRAGAVLDAAQITSDPHLKQRGFFETVTHPEAGTHTYPGMSWKLSLTPGKIRMPAPCFAQHNDYVFGELLGISEEECMQLKTQGVISTVPIR